MGAGLSPTTDHVARPSIRIERQHRRPDIPTQVLISGSLLATPLAAEVAIVVGASLLCGGCFLLMRGVAGNRAHQSHRSPTFNSVEGAARLRSHPSGLLVATTSVVVGLFVTIKALLTLHPGLHLSHEKLGPFLLVTGLGLLLGMRHSTDADHVVAISTIVSKQRSIRSAALIGSVWGLGHTITIVIVGSLIILFGVEIPPRLGLSMEFSVAIMLILLGILNLTGLLQKITRRLTPAVILHDVVPHQHTPGRHRHSFRSLGLYHFLRPLFIGLVHGLAGSAAVALLVLSTIHDPVWATIYLLIFGLGTMLGMMCMTAAIAVPLVYAGDRFARVGHYVGLASGMVSLCFGSFLVYQLGFLGGLFTSHPQWTPR
jgi:hypothetical protein